jgi:hypothetical protein
MERWQLVALVLILGAAIGCPVLSLVMLTGQVSGARLKYSAAEAAGQLGMKLVVQRTRVVVVDELHCLPMGSLSRERHPLLELTRGSTSASQG